ncbi:MAG: P-loop NTPase fold protein [Planctomycetaceae bacterium]
MAEQEELKLPTQAELSSLSTYALAAYAGRCAWRAFPLLAAAGDFLYWTEESRERHLRSIDAALTTSIRHALVQYVGEDAEVSEAAFAAADAAAAAHSNPVVYQAAFAAAYASISAFATANSSKSAAEAALRAVRASVHANTSVAFITATWRDLNLLKDAGDSLRAINKLLGTPLFVNPPNQWGELRTNLQGALSDLKLDSIWHRFEALERGKLLEAMDWDEDLARWRQLIAEHERNEKAETSLESIPQVQSPLEAVDDSPPNKVDVPPPRDFSHLHGTPVSLSDELASQDLLGRTPLVNALTRMFMAPQQGTPFTIALLANWGAGKSSVLNLVKKKIQERARQHAPDSPGYREFDFAEFNAWEYEHTDCIAAGLAKEVVRGIIQGAGSKWERTKLILWFCLREYQAKLVAWLMGINVFLILLFTTIASPSFREVLFSLFSPKEAGGLSAVAVWGLLLAALYQGCRQLVLWWDDAVVQQVDTYLKLPNYDEQLGRIPLLRRQLDSLCSIRLGFPRRSFYRESMRDARWFVGLRRCLRKWYASYISRGPRRLIVFVDDLDRCEPECIVSTFDAVRLVMDRKDVIVVIAIDPRIAVKAIAEHYEKLADEPGTGKGRTKEEIARDYLGKIIQLPVQLSPPHPENLSEFIQQRLFPDVDMTDVPNTSRDLETVTETPSSGSTKPDSSTAQLSGEMSERSTDAEQRDELGLELTERDRTAAIEPAERITTAEEDAHILQETPDEVRVFTKLASGLDIHNPRRLTRLRNSYRLLKFIVAEKPSLYDGTPVQDGDEMARCTFLLNALFLNEYLCQCHRDIRSGWEDFLSEFAANSPGIIRIVWSEQEVHDLRVSISSSLVQQIRSLVLPHDIAGHNGYADGEAE